MSDILIRNIKMPKNCLECPCFQFEWFDDDIDGYCKALKTKIMNRSKHHPDCPLVEIPTPHGQLGDLDALQEQIKLTIQDAHMGALWKQGMIYAHGLVEASKIIIEAEEENI